MDLFAATRPLRQRPWVGYALAIAGPAIGLAIRLALGDALKGFPFLTFFPAILIAAFVGGWRPGSLAALISAALANYYFIAPFHSFVVVWPDGWIALLFFTLVSATFIGLVHVMNGAMARLSAFGDRLRRLNRALERRVRRRTDELQQANARLRQEIATRETAEAQFRQIQKIEALGQLTGGVAHDFNNMLAIIIGNLDIARRRLAGGRGDVLPAIDNAIDGAHRGAALTQRLLAFSRQQPLAPVVTDINTLVRSMEQLLRRTIGEAVRFEFVLGADIWSTRVDTGQLESAILNLTVNARDAMPEGGRLTVETLNTYLDDSYAATHPEVAPGQYVMVAVSDSGIGMLPEVAARAFDPFYTTKPVGQGTGLGLSQVYGFMKQSGGHVRIYSEPGQGTTVRLYLRREDAGPSTPDDVPEAAAGPTPKGTPETTILVVEDEEQVRRATVAALRELGYSVQDTGSPEEALAILEQPPEVDLLFTDMVMPGMTGRKLADIAVQHRPGLKVVYTTGYTPKAILYDDGIDVLSKPFSLDQLARKIRSALDGTGPDPKPVPGASVRTGAPD